MKTLDISSLDTCLAQVSREVSEEKERVMLGQLNELVSRGILVWEETAPVLCRDPQSDALKMVFSGRLVLKNQEYVEKLEKRVDELEEILNRLRSALGSEDLA